MLSSHNPDHPANDAQDGVPGGVQDGLAGDVPAGATLDDLIARTRRLRDDLDAARRGEPAQGAAGGLRRAAWELAADRLADVGEQLDHLRSAGGAEGRARLGMRIGSAEWNLLTDGVVWSEELFAIFGRPVQDGPLTLDQLPAMLPAEDQPALTAAVTGCLVDGRPVDCEFRITRPDGSLRTVQMAGEPVLDDGGGTVAMWAMIRDVSEVRRSGSAAPSDADGGDEELRRQRTFARAGHGVVIELEDSALAPWLGSSGTGRGGGRPGSLELAARWLPARPGTPMSGKWYDSMELPDGGSLLSVGDLSGRGPAAAAGTATALGAVRGIALTGTDPGRLLGHLNQLLDRGVHPVLASALCCRYDPGGRLLTWAQAGHPAPLLCREGTGWALPRPAGPLLGAITDADYEQRTDRLEPGDVLVLHTDGLFSDISPGGRSGHGGDVRLIALAPRLAEAASADECLRLVIEECGETSRDDDACVLIARVRP
ncbi:SpoIIE family protein phosphatase [Streptomyces sp. DSM 44917]|uniref:SpoIIE family protein phosphatase n=1 Tax=Streptomyces boetiae TaxID=3075541 RepID=A0ABU2LEY2_9ACTN|nr:SpoIIE family protein phosphatase [Streptomyces sp. DSM 44917]MDT0310157.1 SpoIIE family protein phosphatase [Streptomyces sp. DSM 44917]